MPIIAFDGFRLLHALLTDYADRTRSIMFQKVEAHDVMCGSDVLTITENMIRALREANEKALAELQTPIEKSTLKIVFCVVNAEVLAEYLREIYLDYDEEPNTEGR